MTSFKQSVVLALTALLVVGWVTGEGWSRPVLGSCPSLVTSATYTQSVDRALRARRDVWGDALLRAPDGPTYETARRFLEPVLFARGPKGTRLTESGVYYLPFTQPAGPEGSSAFGLHVADGSEILAGRATGPALTIAVGNGGLERFGSCPAPLGNARLAAGYLPILETTYVDEEGVRYQQESFAARDPESSALTSYVRLAADARSARGDTEIRFTSSTGRPVSYALPAGTLTTAFVSWPLMQQPEDPLALDRTAYEAARGSLVGYWAQRLSEGEQIVVPERRVVDAERALLIQNLGLTWRYSIGNPYQEFSYPEAIDVAEVMGGYGFDAVSRAILTRSLGQAPTRYPNWKIGQKLVGLALYFRLFRDRTFVEQAIPVLRGYVDDLERQISTTRLGILRRERYSSDIPDSVYGLHSQAIVWQGLAAMAEVWRDTSHPALAERCRLLALTLEHGLRAALRRSERKLADGSIFLDVRLLDHVEPYQSLTGSRFGSYWNLVMPYALASGLLAPGTPEARGVLRYMLLHGSRMLGLVRAGAYSIYGRSPSYPNSGVNPVYGLNVARFLADNHRPDQLVLSLYGQLTAGMSLGTFVAGEAASVAPIAGELYRSMYLPPNGASNASFLGTLQLVLLHETRDRRGSPSGLELAYATPRAWLEPGKRILVRGAPTSFGPLTFSIQSEARAIRVSLDVPGRSRPATLRLRLRVPRTDRISRVSMGGRAYRRFDPATGTLDLSGLSGHLDLVAAVARP